MASYEEFHAKMTEIMACYPRFSPSEDKRQRMMAGYWSRVRGFPWVDVEAALERVPDEHQQNIPTAGELKRMVGSVRTSRCHGDEPRNVSLLREDEKEEAELVREQLPRDPVAQARYVAEAGSEAERVARQWEIEDFNSGRVSWCDTPKEIAAERFAAIQALLQPLLEGTVDG